MKVHATYFQNSKENPLVYGEVEVKNVVTRSLRGAEEKKGILVEPVMVGFCGTDNELMIMGKAGLLDHKFPPGESRLINGHEGIVWVPEMNCFAIVLIRGGDSYDPTRYSEDESYFEYGCDCADGLFCDCFYVNPDMLLPIPEKYSVNGKIPISFAKKMVFPDPYACMLFQLERMEDLGSAHNFRVEMAKRQCDEIQARIYARENIFARTVVFGLGTTGMFLGDLIRKKYPSAKVLFVGRSEEKATKVEFTLRQTKAEYLQNSFQTQEELASAIFEALGGRATAFIGVSGTQVEHQIAFEKKVLGCNGIYNSFSLGPKVSYDTMPFGFENHLIFGSINFRKDHMEQAIKELMNSCYDEIVELIDKQEFIKNPMDAYENKIYSKSAPMKTAVIWNEEHIDWT